MNESKSTEKETVKKGPKVLLRIIVCIAVLAAGGIAMKRLAAMKKPPHAAPPSELAMNVEVTRALPEDTRVQLTGFGVVEPLKTVSIASLVTGRIIRTHERMKTGEVIDRGEILFEIDPADYEVVLARAEAALKEREGDLETVKVQLRVTGERQETLRRTAELARTEFFRVKRLFEKNNVGNKSGVDQAEKTYNSAKDQADQLAMSLELYPVQIRQAEARAASAAADLKKARTDLDRCRMKAPFRLRITEVLQEAGEYVTPGKEVLEAADDSVHEILVALDSRAVSRWMIPASDAAGDQGWFNRPEPVQCTITWADAPDGVSWKGTLNRVVSLDRKSRTTTVAVWVDHTLPSVDTSLASPPLVEGMFCTVTIPGRTIENVIKVPRWAVTTDKTLYVSEKKRLKTRPVMWDWEQGEYLYLSGGVRTGDLIITTRLVDPLENALLNPVENKTP